jgi:hypothetical protein
MTLPWVRIDTDIPSHDKILALLNDRSPRRWQAFAAYICAICWSADHDTDGRIPTTALPFIHATTGTAQLLVKYDLWHQEPPGWRIHNFALRQQTSRVTEGKRREAQRAACIRWHGPDCWGPNGCSRDA